MLGQVIVTTSLGMKRLLDLNGDGHATTNPHSPNHNHSHSNDSHNSQNGTPNINPTLAVSTSTATVTIFPKQYPTLVALTNMTQIKDYEDEVSNNNNLYLI